MTTLTDARVRPQPGRGPSLVRIYRTGALHEFLKLTRVPMFAVSTLAFPLMFYLIFRARSSPRGCRLHLRQSRGDEEDREVGIAPRLRP